MSLRFQRREIRGRGRRKRIKGKGGGRGVSCGHGAKRGMRFPLERELKRDEILFIIKYISLSRLG